MNNNHNTAPGMSSGSRKKAGGAVSAVLLLGAFVVASIYTGASEKGTLAGIYFSVGVIAPSLFIYITLSKLLTSLPAVVRLSERAAEPMMLVLGLVCGFPTGAVTARGLYESGSISKKRAEYICAFSNNPSLSFVLGFAGGHVFPQEDAGIKFSLLLALSSLINMIVFRYILFSKAERKLVGRTGTVFAATGRSFAETVSESALTLISVCAMITLFTCITYIINDMFCPSGIAKVVINGFLEFSGGTALCAQLPAAAGPAAAAAIMGWSGVCVHMQVRSVTGGRFSLVPFVCAKLLQSAVMAAGALLLF